MLMSRLTIRLVQEDWASGIACSPAKCMWARGIRRLIPNATLIQFNPNKALVVVDKVCHHYTVPKRVFLSIDRFERGEPFIPDSITLIRFKKTPSKSDKAEKQRDNHREASKRLRATSGYIRPDSNLSLRARALAAWKAAK